MTNETPATSEVATDSTAQNDDRTLTAAEADVAAGAEPAPVRFEDLDLKPEILQALYDMGYLLPMEVQVAVYEKVAAGRDLMVQARTGTGKTAAFGIPLIQRIEGESRGAQSLILTPTRELALQVAHELHQIAQHIIGLEVVPIYGGAPMKKQIDALAGGAQIVVGTPGRVLDHIRRRTLKTKGIQTLILDECDEMLSMGFQEEIDAIIDTLPERGERQTLLFSATIPNAIQRIARRNMRDPEEISLSTGGISVDEIEHYYYMVSGMARTRDLVKVLHAERPESALIFCNTRDDTNTVAKYLSRRGYNAEAISSDLSQPEREQVMRRMRAGKIQFLAATDVAARGIDISDLSHVINYTFPESPEVYVHRTGRTGRAGKRGVAVSLVGPRDIGAFYYLKLTYKLKPEEKELPSNEEIEALEIAGRCDEVLARISEEPRAGYRELARRVWESGEGERVVGVLLQRLFAERERPVRAAPSRPEAKGTDTAIPERPAAKPAARKEGGAAARETESGDKKTRARRRRSRDAEREAAPREEEGAGREAREGADERPRRRTRRRANGERARTEEAAGRANDEEARPRRRSRRSERRGGEAEEAAATGADRGERGEQERRPRRRRRRRGEGAAESAKNGAGDRPIHRPLDTSSDSGEPKEFWEAWADEKHERPAVPAAAETASETGGEITARLYVNVGKRESITAEEIRNLLGEGLGDDAGRIGSVVLRNTHAYVRVPDELAERVIAAAEGKSYGDREVVVERAR